LRHSPSRCWPLKPVEILRLYPRHISRRQALAVAASVVFHLVVIAALVAGLRARDVASDAPDIQVMMTPESWLHTRAPPAQPAVAARERPQSARAESPGALPAPPPVAPIAGDDARARLFGAPFVGRDAVRDALLAAVTCAHADLSHLSDEEQERCRNLNRQRSHEGPVYAVGPSDPVKRAAMDQAARAGETWRNYRDSRRMDDFPGLRALAGGDPSPPHQFIRRDPTQN
jgi:hypothetical protein